MHPLARACARRLVVAVGLMAAGVPCIGGVAAQEPAEPTARVGNVEVLRPWARATAARSKVGAVFVELRAVGGGGDRLVAAATPLARTVELHDHVQRRDRLEMRRIDAITVPPEGSVILKPGSYHVMLIDMQAPLAVGDRIPLTLTLEKAGSVTIMVPVVPSGAMGPEERSRLKSKSQ